MRTGRPKAVLTVSSDERSVGDHALAFAVGQAASEMRISTCKPAAPIMLTKVSRPNSSILPRMRSEIRGLGDV
jgi:hypothetical protein